MAQVEVGNAVWQRSSNGGIQQQSGHGQSRQEGGREPGQQALLGDLIRIVAALPVSSCKKKSAPGKNNNCE